jgi:hypothetical protein
VGLDTAEDNAFQIESNFHVYNWLMVAVLKCQLGFKSLILGLDPVPESEVIKYDYLLGL